MPAKTTRTLNPLPFQDLEPHRFEDLVRQLAYGLRPWTSLEAVGRGGSDDGIDIRGIESAIADDFQGLGDVDGEDREDIHVAAGEDRLWIIQCKRERSMGPAAVRKVITESLRSLAVAPFGFILAVAADVSKKTRDVFREEMVSRGIARFFIWAKGELEDQLFQPENDRLLFAYFNISLQARQRSASTTIRSEIVIKKQLLKVIEDSKNHWKMVLLRDPTDLRYPDEPESGEPPKRWLTCQIEDIRSPGVATFIAHKRLAAVSEDRESWDMIEGTDDLTSVLALELRNRGAWAIADEGEEDGSQEQRASEFWRDYIEEENRAHLCEVRVVDLRRIMAIDWIGDGFYPIPQIMVSPLPDGSIFNEGYGAYLKPTARHASDMTAKRDKRTSIFPKVIPSTEDLPPPGFDQTLPTSVALEPGISDRLLPLFSSSRNDPAVTVPSPDQDERRSLRNEAFATWKNEVGIPAFSAFVQALRAAGHSARIVGRAALSVEQRGEDFLSLRLKVRRSSYHNPLYWLDGHVTVQMSEYSGWGLNTSGHHGPSNGRGGQAPIPDNGPDRAMLDTLVTSIIEGLLSA